MNEDRNLTLASGLCQSYATRGNGRGYGHSFSGAKPIGEWMRLGHNRIGAHLVVGKAGSIRVVAPIDYRRGGRV